MLHYINDATSLSEKDVVAIMNVCDLEDVFPFSDTYATQVI